MPDETIVAESSTAQESKASADFSAFHRAEIDTALGKTPAKSAEPPPAKEGEKPPAAKSESATPAENKEPVNSDELPPGVKEETQRRFQELSRKFGEAQRRIAELEASKSAPSEPKTVEKSADSTPAGKDGELKPPVKPKQSDFDTYESYEQAKDDYYENLADYKAAIRVQAAEARRAGQEKQSEVQQIWKKREEVSKAKHADFDAVAKNIPFPKDAAVNERFAEFILDSEIGPEILYHLGSNLEDAQRISELGKVAIVRELTRIEDSLKKPPSAPGPKKVPSATPPPSEVGSRSSVAIDEADEALAAGNFTRFHEFENAKALRAHKR